MASGIAPSSRAGAVARACAIQVRRRLHVHDPDSSAAALQYYRRLSQTSRSPFIDRFLHTISLNIQLNGLIKLFSDYKSVEITVAEFLTGQADRIRRRYATLIAQIGRALIEASGTLVMVFSAMG